MRVLHIIHNLRREGAQIVLYNLATQQPATQQQAVLAWKHGGALENELKDAGIPVFVPSSHRGITTPLQILKDIDTAIDEHNIQVLHAHLPDSALWGALASRRRRIPLVVTYHSNRLVPPTDTASRALHRAALYFSSRFTNRHVAVSPSVRERVIQELHIDPDRVTVIVNGVALPSIESRQHTNTANPHIVTVGRLVDIKSYDQIISALPAIIDRYPEAHCTLIGDGPQMPILKKLADELDMSRHVDFAGATNDVGSYLSKADIYVSTSKYEGIPMATLEAMAWGVPTVVSAVPGNLDVVSDGVSGMLYPWGDTKQLSERILHILAHPDQAREMADSARANTAASYSVDAMCRQYAELYDLLA